MAEAKEVKEAPARPERSVQDELAGLIDQFNQIQAQIDAINAVIADLYASLEVLDYLATQGKGKTVLVPIGAGNFIKARIEDTASVVMSVGGRLNVEVSVEDAKKAINERIRTLEAVRLDLLTKLGEIRRRITELAQAQQQA